MANMLDYVFWRGDLTFENVPFNEIDALILCQITYLNFDNIISRDFTEKAISLKDLNTVLSRSENLEKIKNVGAMINMDSWNLFTKAALSVRFGSLKAWGFVNKIDREKEEQFAAVTYTYSGDKKNKNKFNCIVFRGTDDTIVGWKEDFNLGYMETVPAQNDALSYVKEVCSKVKGPIKIAGHSKGGNLAIYSSTFSEEKIQKRIQDIY